MKHLLSSTQFILHLRGMTTPELCRTYPKSFSMPEWNGDKDDMVKKMLGLDARLWKIVGEYAKLMVIPINQSLLFPIGNEGNVPVEKPNEVDLYNFETKVGPYLGGNKEGILDYLLAMDNVLFKGFTFEKNGIFCRFKHTSGEYIQKDWAGLYYLGADNQKVRLETVGDLVGFGEVELTDVAKKKIGLL